MPTPRPPHNEGGYITVLAIVVLLVLSLGLVVSAQYVQSTRLLVDRLDDERRHRLELLSQTNRLAFALVRHRDNNLAGVEALFASPGQNARSRSPGQADPATLAASLVRDFEISEESFLRPLTLAPGIDVVLINETGLIDLNARNDNYLEFIATRLGAPNPAELVAALRDFTDADTQVRPGGAEQSSYGDTVRVPNLPLRHRDDICKVRGWSALDMCRDPGFRAVALTTGAGSTIVPEDAPPVVQRLLVGEIGLTQTVASAWLEASGGYGFFDLALSGNRGNGRYRLVFRFADRPDLVGVSSLQVLPASSGLPFEVSEAELVPVRPGSVASTLGLIQSGGRAR